MTDTSQYVQLLNYSGCGNTVSGNHPVTQRMIVDSLRMCGPAAAFEACRCPASARVCAVVCKQNAGCGRFHATPSGGAPYSCSHGLHQIGPEEIVAALLCL